MSFVKYHGFTKYCIEPLSHAAVDSSRVAEMTTLLIGCLAREDGQDLVEYSLLMAFVIVTMAGLVMGIGDSVKTITSVSASQISAANAMIS